MSDDSHVEVGITADTSQMKAEIARGAQSARSSFSSLSEALNGADAGFKKFAATTSALRKQFDSLKDGIVEVDRQFKAGQVSAAEGAAIIGRLKTAFQEVEEPARRAGMATAGVTREFVVLGHEALSGNFGRMPGSLSVLATRMGLLTGETMAAVGVVAALGVAFYATVEAINSTRNAITNVTNALASMGRLPATQAGIQGISNSLGTLKVITGLSGAEASKFMGEIEKIPEATAGTRWALEKMAGDFKAINSDQDIEQIGQQIRTAFSSVDGLIKFSDQTRILNSDQRRLLESFKADNDVLPAQAVVVQALTDRYREAGKALRDWNNESSVMRWLKGESKGPDASKLVGKLGQDKGPSPEEAQQKRSASLMPEVTEQSVDTFRKIATAAGQTKAEVDATVVQMWQNVIQVMEKAKVDTTGAQKSLLDAQVAAQRSAAAEAVSIEELKFSQMEKAGASSRESDLGNQLAKLKAEQAVAGQTAEEYRARETQMNVISGQLADERKAQQLRSIQEEVAATREGTEERIAAIQHLYLAAVASYGRESTQAKQAVDASYRAQEQYVDRLAQLDKLREEGLRKVDEIELQSQRETLDAQVAAGQISAAARLQIERRLTTQLAQEEMQRLYNERAALTAGTAAYQETENKILALAAKTAADLNKIEAQSATQQRVEMEKSAQQYGRILQPMGRAFDGMVTGVLQGTQTVRQAFQRMGSNMAVSFAESITSMLLKEAAYRVFMMLGFSQMALATAATESEKSAAVAAGSAARTSTAAAEMVAKKAINAEGVSSDAGAAAASVYKDVAAIPYVGWILAPPAAAAAYAAVSAFSAEGGMGSVPYDNAPFLLHKNEMVLPSSIATPLRSMIGAAGSGNGNGGTQGSGTTAAGAPGDTHVHFNVSANDGASVARFFASNGSAIAKAITGQVRNLNSGLVSAMRGAQA